VAQKRKSDANPRCFDDRDDGAASPVVSLKSANQSRMESIDAKRCRDDI